MAIMIIFETIEGQTGKIVQFIENLLLKSACEVRLVDTANRLVKGPIYLASQKPLAFIG